jgi:hypothetical protein
MNRRLRFRVRKAASGRLVRRIPLANAGGLSTLMMRHPSSVDFPWRNQTMRPLLAVFTLAFATIVLTSAGSAQDKKEAVLKGLITCNKCDRGKTAECETVLVVTDDKKKETVYIFDNDSHAKYHDGVCSNPKKGTVTGVVKTVDEKKVISVKKLEYAK